MGIDKTPEQKELRKKERKLVSDMKTILRLHRRGAWSKSFVRQASREFDKQLAQIHAEEIKLGMDLHTIDLS